MESGMLLLSDMAIVISYKLRTTNILKNWMRGNAQSMQRPLSLDGAPSFQYLSSLSTNRGKKK